MDSYARHNGGGNQNPQFSDLSNPQIIETLQKQNIAAGQQEEILQDPNQEQTQEVERKWLWAFPQIEGVPPTPRGGHSATLTGASLVIFGGHYYVGQETGFQYLNDTHVLDVNSSRWIKPKISGSRIIIFGGKGPKGAVFRDLHALDPVSMTWYQGPEGGGAPSARFDHTANLVSGTKMFVFGGWNGQDQYAIIIMWTYLEIMAWSKPNCTGPAPSPRKGHCSILIGTNLVVHGGFQFSEDKMKKIGPNKMGSSLQECYLNDIRVLDTESFIFNLVIQNTFMKYCCEIITFIFIWSRLRVSGSPPEHRFGHTMDISGSDIILYGGWTKTSGARFKHEPTEESCDYFMIWSTDTMSWKRGQYIGNPPTSRFGHTSTSIGPHLLIFGGWEYTKAQNEIIVLRECTNKLMGDGQENNGQ